MASTGTTTPTSKRERSATPPVPSSKSTSKPPASSAAASIDETPDVKKLKVDDNTPVASLPSSSNAVEASSDVKPGGALAAETPEARGEASTEAGPSTTRTYYTGPAVPRPADPNSNKSKKRAKAAAAGGQGGRGRKAYQGKGRERNEQDAAARQSGSTWGPAREGGGEKADRLPKKKTAVLIGFSGTGYNGMQIQKGREDMRTIEGALFNAFVQAGAVSKDNAEDPNKVALSRAARTDAGVHASGNVVSLKLSTELPDLVPEEELIGISEEDQQKVKAAAFTKKINSFLPESIRMWGYMRVQNAFNARTACDSRMYEYLLPSHVLLPPQPTTAMAAMLARQADGPITPHSFWTAAADALPEQLKELRKAWRIDPGTLARTRETAKAYEGTHNFHNFTVDRHFNDRASQRYILSMDVRDPVVVNGIEWVSFRFHGQSFMLHQIRKMMGMLILIVRSSTPASLLPECYGPRKIHVPKAPSLGLLLDRPIFGSYNDNVRKAAFSAAKEPIEFDAYSEEVEEFRRRVIYEKLREEEEAADIFSGWLAGLDSLQGPDFDFLNPRGIIPPQAVRLSPKERTALAEQAGTDSAAPAQEVGESDEELDGVDSAAYKNAEMEG